MLKEVTISNFKSLKNVRVRLGPIAFFCGPNASGKTNLAEAFDFLSHVFRNGLQYAVAEKGGYYNICFRRKRRTKSSIAFRVISESKLQNERRSVLEVAFAIKARTQAIGAEFVVESEEYKFLIQGRESRQASIFKESSSPGGDVFIQIKRTGESYVATSSAPGHESFREYFGFKDLDSLNSFLTDFFTPSSQQLLLSPAPGLRVSWLGRLRRNLRDLEGLRVFQLNPRTARQAGTPSVIGGLGRHGENLPVAVATFLKKKHLLERLLSWTRDVVPALDALESGYTETKRIGLFLHERGFGAPWYAEDLSDGTIMSLALFICLLEPRHRTVLIEEPENSLHPWILKRFLDRCREVSQERQILITTHSPLVVATAEPEELFLVERRIGETEIIPAITREPALSTVIKKDLLDLGEYWVSGGLGAIPEPPEETEQEGERNEEVEPGGQG